MRAIILAAGEGSRLRPLTETKPKCMVPVHGRPLLEYTFDALLANGVEEAVIVTGYLGSVIRDTYGGFHGALRLHYVDNPDYATTGNLYSLWTARGYMHEDMLLIESDLIYGSELLSALLRARCENAALLDAWRPELDGTVVSRSDGEIQRFVLKKNQGEGFEYDDMWKTINIYRFSKEFANDALLPALDSWVGKGDTNGFYEAVIAELVADGKARIAPVLSGRHPWAEIDDVDDLRRAELLFGPKVQVDGDEVRTDR